MPIAVVAIEPVAKLHALGNEKRRRSVINLQVVGVGGKLKVICGRELLSVNNNGFDVGLCRQSLLQNSGRIHHFQKNPAGKPYAPILRERRRIETWSSGRDSVELIIDPGL